MIKIALIGHGAISVGVLACLQKDPEISVRYLLTRSNLSTDALAQVIGFAPHVVVQKSLGETDWPDLLVECAGHTAVSEHVIPALERGIPCVVSSIGAFSEPFMAARLEAAAKHGCTQLHLPAGAVGGIDALSAARVGGLDSVLYVGRKPPSAWKGTSAEKLCSLDKLDAAFCIFDGSAEEAAQQYPKNANVAATIALAGLGMKHTKVQLYADPSVMQNVHQVWVSGAFGEFELTLRGNPLEANPKTSALTVYSVVRAIRHRQAGIVV